MAVATAKPRVGQLNREAFPLGCYWPAGGDVVRCALLAVQLLGGVDLRAGGDWRRDGYDALVRRTRRRDRACARA